MNILKNPALLVQDVAAAVAITGGLSQPSKMPGFSWNIPAVACLMGSLLRTVPGSVCNKCYALKGRYFFPKVQQAMERRLQALKNPLWVYAMAFLINYYRHRSNGQQFDVFRWFDSGDLQGDWHLEMIIQVCKLTPDVRHWMPTREYKIVRNFIESGQTIPKNLVIRFSAPKVGQTMKSPVKGIPVATVGVHDAKVQCEAYTRGGKCGDCRICWTKSDVNYPIH